MKPEKWIKLALGLTFAGLFTVAFLNFIVDPCFHYRQPWKWVRYQLHDERYQNDGIQKHFRYDALVIGSSMTENFKTSQVKEIFGLEAVKTPYSGGYYKEINDALNTAISHNGSLKMVIRGLDLSMADRDADAAEYSEYPEYLYDDDPWNDMQYLLNKDITMSFTLPTVLCTIMGRPSTSFDVYANWSGRFEYGAEVVLGNYYRIEIPAVEQEIFPKKDKEIERENVRRNVVSTVKEHPEIEFYYFLTPYSIVFWDSAVRGGTFDREIEVQRILIEELLEYENCHLFSWCDKKELVCDLDNYRDGGHYGEWVNSQMLQWMHDGEGRLTADNYEAYLAKITELYANYDYDALFE